MGIDAGGVGLGVGVVVIKSYPKYSVFKTSLIPRAN